MNPVAISRMRRKTYPFVERELFDDSIEISRKSSKEDAGILIRIVVKVISMDGLNPSKFSVWLPEPAWTPVELYRVGPTAKFSHWIVND